VRTRAREFAVRLAIGATPRRLTRHVLGGFVPALAAALVAGLLGSTAALSALGAVLYGVAPGDPLILAGAATVVGVVASIAMWLPARRLAAIDPARLLQDAAATRSGSR
jgi:ABC-type antimicrobial peptide transport system permease subunit